MTLTKRGDEYPTTWYAGYGLRPGRVFPFGATFVQGGVNFSIYSSHATSCTLVLFQQGRPLPLVEIPFPEKGEPELIRWSDVQQRTAPA